MVRVKGLVPSSRLIEHYEGRYGGLDSQLLISSRGRDGYLSLSLFLSSFPHIATELNHVVVFSRVTKEETTARPCSKALLIKRDTGPLTYDLHVRVGANWAKVRRLCINFALVCAAGMKARILQYYNLVIRLFFLKQKMQTRCKIVQIVVSIIKINIKQNTKKLIDVT